MRYGVRLLQRPWRATAACRDWPCTPGAGRRAMPADPARLPRPKRTASCASPMRLTDDQRALIRDTVAASLGRCAQVLLFRLAHRRRPPRR
ncbi:MAG: hypothetical protein MZW92_58690 [Comamonadaceae bacterium]|nr:hypothetical protein [Comamonadaceae bacterium]